MSNQKPKPHGSDGATSRYLNLDQFRHVDMTGKGHRVLTNPRVHLVVPTWSADEDTRGTQGNIIGRIQQN